MDGFSHYYHLGESSFIFSGFRWDFNFLFHFLVKFLQANRIAPDGTPRSAVSRWDAAFCGVTSGAIRFAYVPQKGHQAYMKLFIIEQINVHAIYDKSFFVRLYKKL